MQLTQDAIDIGFAIREREGPDVVGVGPDTPTLVGLDSVSEKDGKEIRAALNELERWGLIKIDYCIGTSRPGIPTELRGRSVDP